MPRPLTSAADLACTAKGPVGIGPGRSGLLVGGAPVLTAADWPGSPPWTVTCPVTKDKGGCTLLTGAPTAGVSTSLLVGGQGVLLDTVRGPTDATHTVALAVPGSAGQTDLEVAR
ncbi:hypothetical protein [Modestobacter lapidis]|nr:hypothetical protein [Modestobacter lapidis]